MKQDSHIRNVLIYCRESRDDGFINYERIETQRDILVAYCKNKNLGNIVDIILDDNKSGTDFERLEPVKDRIRNREITVLLMKDASRLGRNILESLIFTEFLEKQGVELVFESERYDEDMFPLIAWFNERRAKDDSVKIRRVLRHKMEKGELVIRAPYGYIKQGNQLLIDAAAAPAVREIFRLFLSGYSRKEIAAAMNRKGWPTPSQRKAGYRSAGEARLWNIQQIGRILRHLAYTGDMPYGMRTKVSYKSKKYKNIAPEDWIVLPNHHAPIISREEFEQAQRLMKKNRNQKVRNPSENIFSGLLFCGRCGSRMYRKTQNGKSPWYVCGKNDREGAVREDRRADRGCGSHRIRETVLTDIVKEYILRLIYAPVLREEILAAVETAENGRTRTPAEIKIVRSRIEALKQKASKVYDDRLEGRLPEYLLAEKLQEITAELNELEKSLPEPEQEHRDTIRTETDIISGLAGAVREKDSSHQILSLLFQKVIVYAPEEISADAKERYGLEEEEYAGLCKNGGILFVQNLKK